MAQAFPALLFLVLALGSEPAQAQTQHSAGASLTIAAGNPDDAEGEQQRAIAHGQEPPAKDEAPREPATGGAGLRGTFGRTLTQNAAAGWFGRIELEAFSTPTLDGGGPVGGALIGGEVWTSPDGGGGGLPMSFFLGFRSPLVISTLGFGVDLFVVDRVKDDGGFGIYAPFGAATLGLDFGSFRILADARAIERWQWGAPDRPQLQLGFTLSQILTTSYNRRRPRP